MMFGAPRNDPHEQLCEALIARFPAVTIKSSRRRPWASATFNGARHFFTLAGASRSHPSVDALENDEFALSGHIVADIVMVEQRSDEQCCEIEIEALTVEEV